MKALFFCILAISFTPLVQGEPPSSQSERKVVLVTGASRGTGKAIALHLARSGDYTVYATMRKPAKDYLTDKEELGNLFTLPLDVTSANDCQKVVKDILKKENRIDVLINNAGQGLFGCTETVEIKQAQDLFEVNFFGPMRLIQEVLPSMRERKQGLIINMSSIVALSPAPCWDLYNASKYALEGLSESLAIPLAHWNINVVLIEPGLIATDFVEVAPVGKKVQGSPYQVLMTNIMNDTLSMLPTGQAPDEIAALVQTVIETDKPNLRYQTPDYTGQMAAEKFIDPAGNAFLQEESTYLKKLWEPRSKSKRPALGIKAEKRVRKKDSGNL